MVVAGVPMGKIFYVIIKQMSRPISRRMQSFALQSPFFKNYICIPPASAYNWLVTNVRIRTMGTQGKVKVIKLTEDKAIELGAEIIGELTIFTISTLIIVAEYSRQSKKSQAKEDTQNKKIKTLESELVQLKSQMNSQEKSLEQFQKQQSTRGRIKTK